MHLKHFVVWRSFDGFGGIAEGLASAGGTAMNGLSSAGSHLLDSVSGASEWLSPDMALLSSMDANISTDMLGDLQTLNYVDCCGMCPADGACSSCSSLLNADCFAPCNDQCYPVCQACDVSTVCHDMSSCLTNGCNELCECFGELGDLGD